MGLIKDIIELYKEMGKNEGVKYPCHATQSPPPPPPPKGQGGYQPERFKSRYDCADYRRCNHYIDCLKSDICYWRGRMKPASSDDPESGCSGYKMEDKADGI